MLRRALAFTILLLGFFNLGFGPPGVVDVAGGGLPIYASQVAAERRLRLPEVSAEAFAVVDGESGELIGGLNADTRLAPASTTKIASAIVALERGRLDELVEITVDSRELYDSSVMGLLPGDTVSLRDLLYGLLLPSGNDAALAIAEYIGGDVEGFAALMNAKVAELGLLNTHFVNPHGLDDPDHYSSPYDLALLARYAMRIPEFAAIVRTREYAARGTKHVYELINTNELLGQYRGVDGVKTGSTENALQALVTSAARDNRRAFVVVIRSEDRYADTPPLLDYYFDNFIRDTLDLSATALTTVSYADRSALNVGPRPAPSLILPGWQWRYVRPIVWLDPEVPEALARESRLGFVAFYLGNRLLAEAPLYAR